MSRCGETTVTSFCGGNVFRVCAANTAKPSVTHAATRKAVNAVCSTRLARMAISVSKRGASCTESPTDIPPFCDAASRALVLPIREKSACSAVQTAAAQHEIFRATADKSCNPSRRCHRVTLTLASVEGVVQGEAHVSAHPDGNTGELGHLQKEQLPSMRRMAPSPGLVRIFRHAMRATHLVL
jgi:hypothetical protein